MTREFPKGRPPWEIGRKPSTDRGRRDLGSRAVHFNDLTDATKEILAKADPSVLELLELAIDTLKDINIRLAKMSSMDIIEW